MKNILILIIAVTASLSAYAQKAPTPPNAVSYNYGMQVNTSQVVSIFPIADVCAPILAQITYKDAKGEVHILGYSVMGAGCSN